MVLNKFNIPFEIKVKFCLHKAYFEKGYGLTHYIKYIIAFFGLATHNLNATMWFASLYALGCYVLGAIWYNSDMMKAEAEVGNRFNLFVEEMRKLYKGRKHK